MRENTSNGTVICNWQRVAKTVKSQLLKLFISWFKHQMFIFTHTMLCYVGMCYGNSFCLSVRLWVTCMLCIKTAKRFVEILLPSDSPIILVFHHRGLLLNSDGFTPNGPPNIMGEKIGWFLTNKSVYLGNGVRYSHSCYRSQIGNHTRAKEWCHFRWPWVTPTRSFKVTL